MNVDERKDLRPLETCITPECVDDAILGERYCEVCKLKAIKAIRVDLAKFYTRLENKLLEKVGEYGASYKTSDIKFLEKRLVGEIEEHQRNPTDPDELIDIAAVCMMLHSRVKKD
jgi:hypothetical protein